LSSIRGKRLAQSLTNERETIRVSAPVLGERPEMGLLPSGATPMSTKLICLHPDRSPVRRCAPNEFRSVAHGWRLAPALRPRK
jgi:hypothetical protein